MRNPNIKILILCNTGLGNILLFIPTYKKIRSIYPNAEYTVLLDERWYKDEFIRLQFGHPTIIDIFPEKKSGLAKRLSKVIKLRKTTYDLVFRPYSGTSLKIAASILFLKSKFRIFYKTSSFIDFFFEYKVPLLHEHYIFRNYRQIEGISGALDYSEILQEISQHWVDYDNDMYIEIKSKKDRKWIALHPGGNNVFSDSRRWPTYKYINLIRRLLNYTHLKIILIGSGNYEEKLINEITKNLNSDSITVIHNNPLAKVASFLKNCDLFIGNDSGIMNLSFALGVPTLAILGPTDPVLTGPFGKENKVIHLNLECMPCFETGLANHCNHRNCLNTLDEESVFSQAIFMLKK